jgi:hypothetical protein
LGAGHVLEKEGRADEKETREMSAAADAIGDRLAGSRPSRTRSFIAAVVIGGAAAVVAYRFLRGTPAEAE